MVSGFDPDTDKESTSLSIDIRNFSQAISTYTDAPPIGLECTPLERGYGDNDGNLEVVGVKHRVNC